MTLAIMYESIPTAIIPPPMCVPFHAKHFLTKARDSRLRIYCAFFHFFFFTLEFDDT